jgi:hypothetical protein
MKEAAPPSRPSSAAECEVTQAAKRTKARLKDIVTEKPW